MVTPFDLFKRNNRVNKEERNARYAVCKACPDLLKTGQCKHCGCFMRQKTKLKCAECPIGKWDMSVDCDETDDDLL